jgi:hypothetical protein
MQKRPLVSLSIAAGFVVLTVTGVLLFWRKHSNVTAAIHTSFAALFLLVALFHIANNLKPLVGYAWRPGAAVRRGLVLGAVVVAATLLVTGTLREWPGFAALYEWGNQHRVSLENRSESRVVYQQLTTDVPGEGVALELDVRKGSAFDFPVFALWIEDLSGHYLETLYVSKAIGTSRFSYGREVDGRWIPDVVRRPEALPYWGHQRGVRARDGYYLPDPASPLPDAISAATPTESFTLTTDTGRRLSQFRILLEVNQSFDWNDFFSQDRFPDDPIYSGSGKVGQPSVVYGATIDLSQHLRAWALNPLGHGHPSGRDGSLDTDLSRLTTALDIIRGASVTILPGKSS